MQMMVFWAAAGGMTALGAAALARAVLRRPRPHTAPDLDVYRQQLAELDRDVARAAVSAEDADRLRVEISRRMLEADRAARPSSTALGRGWGIAGVAALTALALPLYLHLGAPGYPDLGLADRVERIEASRADRPSQAEAERTAPPADRPVDPPYAGLVQQLRDAVAARPDDIAGLRLLVRNEAALGNYAAAATAQRHLISLGSDTDGDQLGTLGELMVRAAGGYVSPEAESVLRQGLSRNPDQPTALYLMGMTMAQGGRPDLAYRYLNHALRVAPDAAWRTDVLAIMPDIAMRAGVAWTPPEAAPTDIAALPPEDQARAVQGMVDGLAARLNSDGGDAEEWMRLMRAYAVLGRPDAARDAWQRGRAAMTTDDDRAALDAALAELGLE
ncbi:c-type cytochrome biogenesis protein CcmI [Falsirhodobacter halotolerans]|uniref:c-type cytochrome biogenesis protein CcmI n=1 Tax=Falsirhodobacter halotolerans TaxID=1146892 RepID=UPI001FD2C07A|nr:c-type cytochrome biogenesis protein CcmI [Falsirhodobacter halotolerans]MCJ8139620.1 c-type cytochrome biogenesis protein CcmI [Falsirhodobacter halotolerans]